jgi:hypothetical protein
MNCVLCAGQGHHWTKCPLFGKPEEFIQAFAPQPLAAPESPVKARPSLASNIEEVFGQDKERALQEVLDDPTSPQEEKMLALELLIGTKKLSKLDEQDQETVTGMSHRMLFGSPRPPSMPQASQPNPRPKQVPDTSSDPYSSVNYDFDRDSQNQPV